ncbi:cupredoxin domain-containing protein [Streptomyces platensis]|uniref:peptidase n=1 Tax=Streptomyces platensis TaxID=58346 RepID=UPI0030E072FC
MPSRLPRTATLTLLTVSPLALLAACAEKNSGGSDAESGAITVQATDDTCKLSRTSAPAGPVSFKVVNEGSRITEFYLYAPDGKVASKVEGIGPDTSRTMTVKTPGVRSPPPRSGGGESGHGQDGHPPQESPWP